MRIAGACALVALAWGVSAGLSAAGAQKAPKPRKPTTITLTGCVQKSETVEDQYTIDDVKKGTTYRLTGIDVRDYVGRRVQIVGGVPGSNRVKIKGGLVPNANVAAQAGAIDPAAAATAAIGGLPPTGTVELPEFKIKSIKPTQGSCP